MHRLPKVIRPVFLNTRRMSTVNSSESSPVIKVSSTNVDQTAIKLSIQNFKDWRVKRDPPPDVHIVSFSNHKLNYYSYYPPVGFTPEEILQFPGAKR
ncbi:hypothetical protein BT96DRAFT_918870 [Gymnopus androsaceus JB14]|uniref:Uncharacterized protein n=1 Tax=Gymnopus androsaceus JB14 TaxID=1447944 RepID=A0A6A4HQR7_9AGAR|nr:hypothetical protein BT96DRAFT_918870 [Gymnopus androsaceus JB14]